jgi:hypothetical protein
LKFKQPILKYFYVVSSLLLLFLASCGPSSDYRDAYYGHEKAKDKFFADPLVFFDSLASKPRLDLSVEIPIADISFQKNYQNRTYYSKIFITVTVKNPAGDVVLTKTYTETSLYTYEEIKAKAGESQFYLYNYSLNPGTYKVDVEVADDYIKNEYKKSFNITAKDFSVSEISISDLMLLSKIDLKPDGTREISPQVSNNVFGLKELFVFFEIYNNSDKDIPKEYLVKLKNNKGAILKETTFSYNLAPGKNQKFESVFILSDLRKQIPVEKQMDMREKAKENGLSFTLEIVDKSTGIVETQKKLLFMPDRPPLEMMNRPPPR